MLRLLKAGPLSTKRSNQSERVGQEAFMSAATSSPLLDRRLAHFVLRFTLGINILIHGAGRILGPGVGTFAVKTAGEFSGAPLPPALIHAFLAVLPYAETLLGIAITVGLLTRWALTLGGLLIAALVFGTALRSDWSTVGIQMVYAIVYYLLLAHLSDDFFSLDTFLRRRPVKSDTKGLTAS
jgi:thiosulfate dehydrogenase (quinone) large subunit